MIKKLNSKTAHKNRNIFSNSFLDRKYSQLGFGSVEHTCSRHKIVNQMLKDFEKIEKAASKSKNFTSISATPILP